MRVIILLAIFALLLAAGCAQHSTSASRPPGGDLGQRARGERAFTSNCTRCHPAGKSGVGPSLVTRELPGFLILAQVRAGQGLMPAFPSSQLPADRLDDIVAYLRELQTEGAAPPP